ncbi:hypothetical protein B0H13DRAFT_2338830 [Mycena leptocephala]|nr:hypothetical protein B0H13DRAFT_2338830 [Mycena leptocephala]
MRSFSGNTRYLHNGNGAPSHLALTSSRPSPLLCLPLRFSSLASSPLTPPPSSSSYIVFVNSAVAAASQITHPAAHFCKQPPRCKPAEGRHDS